MTKKNTRQRIIIFFLIIFLFILCGFFLSSAQKKNEYFSVKYSIEFNQKTIAILNTIDALMKSIGVQKYKGKTFRKYLEVDLYQNNKTSSKEVNNIKIIGFSTDSILFETKSEDNLDERFKKFIDVLNNELSEKLLENINIYKGISLKLNQDKNKFVFKQLINLKDFKAKSELSEQLNKLKNSEHSEETFKDDIALLSKLIEYFVNEANIESLPAERGFLETIVEDLNTRLTMDNLRYLIYRFKDEKVETNFTLLSLNSFIEELEKNKNFIIPIEQDKIVKDSPNKFLFLILFTLFGIFFAIIYFVLSSKNLRLSMKKRLEL